MALKTREKIWVQFLKNFFHGNSQVILLIQKIKFNSTNEKIANI